MFSVQQEMSRLQEGLTATLRQVVEVRECERE